MTQEGSKKDERFSPPRPPLRGQTPPVRENRSSPNDVTNEDFSEDELKWSCDYCTYSNWKSAVKCTLCRARRPLQRIEEIGSAQLGPPLSRSSHSNYSSSPPPNNGGMPKDSSSAPENLYTVETSAVNEIPQQTRICQADQPIEGLGSSIGKWSCPMCTYLNWPRSKRCVQCKTEKRRPQTLSEGSLSPPPTSSQIQEESSHAETGPKPMTNLRIFVPISKAERLQETKDSSKSFSPPPGGSSDTSGRGSPSGKTAVNLPSTSATLDSRIVAKKLQKWTCHACTYENWPKANRCTICYSNRPGIQVTPRIQQYKDAPNPHSPPYNRSREGSVSASGSQSPNAGSREKKRSFQSGGGEMIGEGTGRKSPKNSASNSSGSSTENIAAAAASASLSDKKEIRLEKQLRRLKQQMKDLDYLWLTAVRSVATSAYDNDPSEAFLAAGGDPRRSLTHTEAQLLSSSLQGYHFEAGWTLFHLALRYHREDLVTLLLASADPKTAPFGAISTDPATSNSEPSHSSSTNRVTTKKVFRAVKRVPCHVSPEVAADIRRQVALSLRQRKGEMPCFYFTDLTTFALPSSIYELSPSLQQRLFNELLDRDVQKELEEEGAIINWSLDVTDRLGSRLYALWNRTAGDCLLDSVLQATWGVFDSENSLRQALSDSLSDAAHIFFPRWKEYEMLVAQHTLQFSLDENQVARDWELVLELASKPGSALEQAHIFVLAHIIRRPIIVYGVRIVKSYRGEPFDFARFEGIYLPVLWEPSFCYRSPICLGYTRGHFTALVPMEPQLRDAGGAIARSTSSRESQGGSKQNLTPRFAYLPLQDADGKLLPMHFLLRNEYGHEPAVMRTWLDVYETEGGGLLCAKMKLHRPPALVNQMLDDWIDHYHRVCIIPTSLPEGSKKSQSTSSVSSIAESSKYPLECSKSRSTTYAKVAADLIESYGQNSDAVRSSASKGHSIASSSQTDSKPSLNEPSATRIGSIKAQSAIVIPSESSSECVMPSVDRTKSLTSKIQYLRKRELIQVAEEEGNIENTQGKHENVQSDGEFYMDPTLEGYMSTDAPNTESMGDNRKYTEIRKDEQEDFGESTSESEEDEED